MTLLLSTTPERRMESGEGQPLLPGHKQQCKRKQPQTLPAKVLVAHQAEFCHDKGG